jgi:hypothetical protein
MQTKPFTCPKPSLTPASQRDKSLQRAGKAHEVTFSVSYRYNGGIIVRDEWYSGYEVPKPDVPSGWTLVSLGFGLQLNAKPPYCTMLLKPVQHKETK